MWVKTWGLICLFCYIRLIICKKSEICEEGSFFKKASWYCIPTTSHYIIQLIWVKESTVQRSHKSQAKHPHIQGDCSTKSGRKKWLHHYMLHPWSKKKCESMISTTQHLENRAELSTVSRISSMWTGTSLVSSQVSQNRKKVHQINMSFRKASPYQDYKVDAAENLRFSCKNWST